ncbi:MAG: class I SAM-dependent methyltransferase [Alphaproteobacteria bacterium]
MTSTNRNVFDGRFVPALVNTVCAGRTFSDRRRRVVPRAEGVVVEAGFGSGLNLAYYDPAKVDTLIGVDPDEAMLRLSEARQSAVDFDLQVIKAGAEAMPIETGVADTVVVAYSLCTIPEPERALAEFRRVLKPSGRLLFVEHGRVDKSWCGWFQDTINRPWGRIAGGCNLNRCPAHMIKEAGFALSNLRAERFPAYMFQFGMHWTGDAKPI